MGRIGGVGEITYQDLAEVLVRDVRQLCAVELRDHELCAGAVLVSMAPDVVGGNKGGGGCVVRADELTAWPLLRGPMSRKARVLSLSNSLKEGISPAEIKASSVCQSYIHARR